MIDNFNCGKRILDLRNLRGWEQTDLASRLGVHQASISKDENAHTLTLKKIKRYCAIFEIPLWQFFSPEDNNHLPLDDNEKLWLSVFRGFPSDFRKMMFDNVSIILRLAKYVYDNQSKFTGRFD